MQMEIYILVSRFKLFNQEYKQRVFADVLHSVLLIGHALNKILKDLINRSKLLQGFRIQFVYFFYFLSKKKNNKQFFSLPLFSCSYVPGYDTHGLPLELKALSALKLPASSLSPQVIRSAARKEAEKGVDLQEDEFIEFGCIGAFGKGEGYKTMDWSYEKRQLGVVREMVRKGESIVELGLLLLIYRNLTANFSKRSNNNTSSTNDLLTFIQNSSSGS